MPIAISPIFNIVESVTQDSISCIYHRHNSIFDLIFKELDINIFDIEYVTDFYYNILFSNNFLDHTQKTISLSKQFHIKDVVMFHDPAPQHFKKEDIAILKDSLARSHKIFTSSNIMNSWGFVENNYNHIINYGIPQNDISDINRKKSIIVFNPQKNNAVNTLFTSLRGFFPDAHMLTEFPNTLSDLNKILQSYKICIDLSHPINGLYSVSCGCYTYSPYEITNVQGFETINNLNQLNKIIINRLAEIDSGYKFNNPNIYQDFSFEDFSSKIINTLSNISKEIFII